MNPPLYVSVPKALRRFKFQSIPRTFLGTLAVTTGFARQRSSKNAVLTFSISEDYARIWHFFARKYLPEDSWDIVLVDCAGTMQAQNFPGAQVVRFANISHGTKIDLFLQKYLKGTTVMLCDDDKYIVADLSSAVHELADPRLAAVSLAPRDWYTIRIGNRDCKPMGSYALLMNRQTILKERLSFQNVKRDFKNRVVPEGTKRPFGYDCADFANEKLLERGYDVLTDRYHDHVLGFDGLSAPRIFLMRYGKQVALDSLAAAGHFKKGSLNGVMARVLYGIVKVEELYRQIFKKDPAFVSELTAGELRRTVTDPDVMVSYDQTDAVFTKLVNLSKAGPR